MVGKSIQARVEYDATVIVGVSKFTAAQLRSIMFEGATRLRTDLTYVIPKQWVHDEKLKQSFNGYDTSRKVFVIGLNDEGQCVTVLTLGVSGLRSSYYGEATEQIMISAVKNAAGLHRAISGTELISVFDKGNFKLTGEESGKAFVAKDFAFKMTGRHQVLIGKFKAIGRGDNVKWDMITKSIDGSDYLDLGFTSMNRYEQLDVVPEINWDQVPDDTHTLITSMQEGL